MTDVPQSSDKKLQSILDTVNDNQKKLDRMQSAELHLLQSDTLPELFGYLFSEYPKIFQLYAVELLLIDTQYGIHRLLEDSGESAKSHHSLQLTTDDATIEKINSLGMQPTLTAYDREEHRWLTAERIPEPASIAILPLVRHHNIIGVATCVSQDAKRFQPSFATDLLQRLASIIAVSIENAVNYHRMQYLGLTDALTGVRNRRFLNQRLIEEVARASGTNSPLSFLFIDIDYFKQVNDQYGHQAGDLVLIEVARRINLQLRGSDILARYGGEEFAVLLANTDIHEAEQISERIRHTMEDSPINCDEQSLSITASIGVAQTNSRDFETMDHQDISEQLTRSADDALYQAKESGRNKIVVAET